MLGIAYRRVEACFIQSEEIRLNISLIDDQGRSLLKWIESLHSELALRVQDPDAWFMRSFYVMDMASHVWARINEQNLQQAPDYCQEHGGHLRNSPACDLAREKERRAAQTRANIARDNVRNF